MNGKLLDTTVLIDLSRRSSAAADYIDAEHALHTPLFLSVVSAMELVAGCRDKSEVEQIKKMVADFGLVHLTPAISVKAYEFMWLYNKSHGLAIPDALIAATAVSQNLVLASDNIRHFAMLPELLLERPY